MIKAILYDLGDIFFEAHYWRKWMWETLSRIGKYDKSFKEFYDLYEFYLLPVYQNKKDYWDAFDDFLHEFHLKTNSEFKVLAKMQKAFYENNRVLYEEVKETLEKIHKKGFKNIVITDNENGAVWVRENILKNFDIIDMVDLVVTSKEAGVTKPDPLIFQNALDYYSLRRDEVFFVGHDKDEINGAEKLGIKTIEFNNYLSQQTTSNIKIDTFNSIMDFL